MFKLLRRGKRIPGKENNLLKVPSADERNIKRHCNKMNRLKVQWITPTTEHSGNALGYATHVRFMKKYSEKYLEYSDDADIALQICPADFFFYVKGKFNVLFTMWEFLELPNKYIANLNRADAIIVPSSFCRDLFRKYTDRPIYVCHEGVEASSFPFFQRSIPSSSQRFRFMWCGAPNPRKGYPLILQALKMIENEPGVEMYIKTTMQNIDRAEFVKKLFRKRHELRGEAGGRERVKLMLEHSKGPNALTNPDLVEFFGKDVQVMGKHKNIVFDRRKLSLDELVDLYNSTHCFLLPTFGEGWGLTLCEAMATGAPCVAPSITGCADFFDARVGYPMGFTFAEQELTNYDNLISMGYCPSVMSMCEKMLEVYGNYGEALRRGKKASERIHSKFTWDIAGGRLYEIIKDIEMKYIKTRAQYV